MDHVKHMLNMDVRLFGGYVFYSGIATLVDFAVLYALTSAAGLWYFYSAAVAYAAGMTTNYALNKCFNFRNRSKEVVRQFGLFALVALVGLGLNQGIIYLLVEKAGLWYLYAKIVSVFIVMFWSFYGHKTLTFKKYA